MRKTLITSEKSRRAKRPSKLFGLIITGETKAIQLMIKDIITVLTTEVIPSQLRVQQTFYAVRLMFEEILIDFDLTDITIPEYDAENLLRPCLKL